MTTISLSDLRKNLPAVVKQIHEQMSRFVITVNGKPKVALISPEEIEAYEETIAILSNQEHVQEFIQAQKDWDEGNTFSYEEAFGKQ